MVVVVARARIGPSPAGLVDRLRDTGVVPCPYFEPSQVASDPHAPHVRLPLISEYDGFCHASGSVTPVSRDLRLDSCNQGHHQGRCGCFPSSEGFRSRRFTVQSRTNTTLRLLVLEEQNHTPVRWRDVEYSVPSDTVAESGTDHCETAQIRAFCRAYLDKFPLMTGNE